jgi:outer membrane receptor protein involved in Fe transport
VAAGSAHAQIQQVDVRGARSGDFIGIAREGDSVRELTDAASLVEPLAGVHVRRFGGDDSFSTLSIRGSSSSEVAVILAGVPLTGGADPSLDLASLPLWPGAVARVHRTFAPAALGPGSLGGTLVLDPPRPTSPEGVDVWAAVGSFGSRRLRVGGVQGAGSGSRIAAAVSASRSDDDFTYVDPLASTPGHDVYTVRQNAGHAAVDALVAWSLPVRFGMAGDGALVVTTLCQDRRQELPGSVYAPTQFAYLESDRELASANLTQTVLGGTWIARAWGKREGSRLRDESITAGPGPVAAADTITALGGALGWRWRWAETARLEAHVDASEEHFEPGTRSGAPPPPDATRSSTGGALDVDVRVGRSTTVTGAARLDAWSDNEGDAARGGQMRPTGHLGLEADVGGVTAAAHGGTTARPPSFVELFGDRGTFVGSPTLRPESAWTMDAGVRRSIHPFGVQLAAELVGFATWAEDLITFVPMGAYGRAVATNIGRARLMGAELDLRAAAGPLEVRVSYTGLATQNEAACMAHVGPCERPPLPGRPADDVVSDAVLRLGSLSVRIGIDAVDGLNADLTGSVLVPARVLTSAGARLDLAPGVRVALDLRNLFDVRVGTYAGVLGLVHEPIGDSYAFPLPGRSVLVSARFFRPTERRP